jgi:peptide chain release factor 1
MIEFKDDDFKIIITKGSGAGGQHRNKVESCVIVTHIATGITEKCEETRSQPKNKKLALERVKERVLKYFEDIKHEELNEERKKSFNERIRTYNYKTGLVTDHRSGKKAPLNKVMNGNLDLLHD